ncbi:uncharacterized protein Tco025E_06064 [Trypanosoma conorhini]|uniref:Uncharacterized protein n=1 Tax=Trypanosoma conorhini TaxID=83891 RepID=A0A422P7N0_9TRYP|nr:uncharacterized protein Tco025E_06064 [Trypanosoma conorhini]RNF13718.1 hypothetical protein Tco025E_06064 [Trypanosoma conorhini]
MLQQAVSYVISGLAKLGDIDASNVETSLMRRTLRIQDMTLRQDTLNAFLPFPIHSGRVSDLRVELPWPTSKDALFVSSQGITLTLKGDVPKFNTNAMTREEIRGGITEESIFGAKEASPASTNSYEEEGGDALENSGEYAGEQEPSAAALSEDDDYMSCRSVSNASFASCESQEDVASLPENGFGLFSFFVNAAGRSVSWVMNRPIHLQLRNTSVMLLCDSQSEVGFEVAAREIVVQIEPASEAGAEIMKVVVINFAGVAVYAHATKEQKQKIVGMDHFSIRVTSVYSSMGVLRRKNIAVIVDGVTSVSLDEDALQALTSCAVSHRLMTEVPDYCRPFRGLLQLPSRWPYAKSCVLAFIRDRRRRYNFNASHLHFYAEARTSYLALLDYCHRTRDIAEKKESLAEVEEDLRYRDVVLFLRRRVQERYSAAARSSNAGVQASMPARPAEAGGPVILSSFHVEAKITCVRAPAKTTVWLRDVAFVNRRGESNFTVGGVTVVAEGKSQQLQASDAGQPFFSFQRTESNGTAFFRTQFEDWRFTATSTWILQAVQPFLVAAPDLLLTVPRTCGGAPEPTSHERRECTTSFIFPLVQLAVDGLQLHLERLSLVFIEQKSGGSRVAFLTEGVARAFWRGNSRAVTHEAGNDARR